MNLNSSQIKIVITLMAMVSLLPACNSNNQEAAITETTPERTEVVESESTLPIEANTVAVELSDFEISMLNSLPAGQTVFEVTNTGEVEHNFEIEGQGIEREFEQNLQPGETETMEVTLEPGTYRVYCPVGNHAQQGMSMELTVVSE